LKEFHPNLLGISESLIGWRIGKELGKYLNITDVIWTLNDFTHPRRIPHLQRVFNF
jgi:hypothetical protein